MEMRVKLALLEEEVKFLKDIFVDYPEIAERVQDSNLVQLIDWVKQRVNSAPDLFFRENNALNCSKQLLSGTQPRSLTHTKDHPTKGTATEKAPI
jgi:hypothetical protein